MLSAYASSDPAIRSFKTMFLMFWLLAVGFTSGCSLFSTGGMGAGGLSLMGLGTLQGESSHDNTYVPVGGDAALPSTSFSQEAYQAVCKAKQENAIVLQILENDEPVRVLPLPLASGPQATSPGMGAPPSGIFVSSLLTQTGVLQKYGRVQAALYRPSPSSFEGVRMDLIFSEHDKHQVRPESDYALRAGDRLVIRKDDSIKLNSILDLALGR